MRKGILQEAVRNCQYWRLKDPAGVWHSEMCNMLETLNIGIGIGDHSRRFAFVYTQFLLGNHFHFTATTMSQSKRPTLFPPCCSYPQEGS